MYSASELGQKGRLTANSEEDSTAIFIELTVLSHVSMYCFCDHKKLLNCYQLGY